MAQEEHLVPPDRSRPAVPPRLLWGVFAVGLVWACAYLVWQRGWNREPFGEEQSIAVHLARGHGFRSPGDELPQAQLTSWSPPVYPYLAAGVYRLAGEDSKASRCILLFLQALGVALGAMAMALIAGRIGGRVAGGVAGLLYMLQPMLLVHMMFYWDSILALAMFLWAAALAQTFLGRRLCMGGAALLGLALAAVALTNASYVLAYPVLAIVAAARQTWGTRLRGIVVMAAVFVAALVPWTIRNYRAFGQVMFVRGGADVEFWLGSLPECNGLTRSVIGRHPFASPAENKRIMEQGETAYFRACHERFIANYRKSPAAFWKRTARRVVYLFVGDPKEPTNCPLMPGWHVRQWAVGHLLVNVGVGVLALGGVVVAWRRKLTGACGAGFQPACALWPLLAGLLSVAPFAVSHVQDRYALPLRAALLIYAALLASWLWRRVSPAPPTEDSA